jgi:hypothetical protein
MISTSASGILGTWENERRVLPAGKRFVLGRTIGNGIIPSIAKGWILGNMGVSALRTLSPRSRDHLRDLFSTVVLHVLILF